MYETYVPIPETTEERRPPTIAEIVREKTDDGARIIDFFLDLMEGRVADAQLCHRIDAAKQLVKYGSKKAADFLAEHGDETCDHCESRKRGPRPRKDEGPAVGPLHVQGPFGYDFLTMLTEDFLTVLSAVDEDLMIMLVRAQTRDGGTVVDFLDDVMYGRDDGFRPNHRIAAARELISHILRDEHRSHILLDNVGADPRVRPLPSLQPPSPVGAGLKPALPGAARKPGNPLSIVPANEEGNPDNPTVIPAKAGTQRGGGVRNASANSAHTEATAIVVPAEAGTQRGGEGGSEPTEEPDVSPSDSPVGAGLKPALPGAASEPVNPPSVVPANAQGNPDNTIVVPANQPVEDPVPTTVDGSLTSVHPEPVEGPRPEFTGRSAANSSVVLANEPVEEPVRSTANAPQPETRPQERTRTQRRREGNARAAMRRNAQGTGHNNKTKDKKPAPAELTPAERRIREKLDAHWHDPDPYGAPIDSTNPGRSPPR